MYTNVARHSGRNELLLTCLSCVEYFISLSACLEPLLPGPPPPASSWTDRSLDSCPGLPSSSSLGSFTCSPHGAACHLDSTTSSFHVSVLVCGGCVFQELSENEYEGKKKKKLKTLKKVFIASSARSVIWLGLQFSFKIHFFFRIFRDALSSSF